MRHVILFLLLVFNISSHAQTSPRIDSSLTSIQTHLHKNRAQQIDKLRKCLADSGTYKRLDTMNYPYVVIHTSSYKNTFIIEEIYYTNADSAPAMMYTNNELESKEYYPYFKSYNEIVHDPDFKTGISKKKYKPVQHYYHACIVPTRKRARGNIKARVGDYEVSVYMNKSSGSIKTQTVLPRRFHPFIIKMEGGLF